MATIDDLARMAALAGIRVTREELEQEASLLQALLADQDKLFVFPFDDREPAFIPWPPRESRSTRDA